MTRGNKSTGRGRGFLSLSLWTGSMVLDFLSTRWKGYYAVMEIMEMSHLIHFIHHNIQEIMYFRNVSYY